MKREQQQLNNEFFQEQRRFKAKEKAEFFWKKLKGANSIVSKVNVINQ